MSYRAPLSCLRFALHHVLGLEQLLALPAFSSLSSEMIDAVLEEAGKFAEGELAPLNASGDKYGARWHTSGVTTAPGWREAYQAFVANGWNTVPFPVEYGGQGLPWMVSSAISELWSSANMAFALCPLLTQGGIELLLAHGSDEQKAQYLPKLISGEWTATMCLTEPSAGSDVGALTTSAIPAGDGTYIIKGQKIFITYGDHDMTENIIHMVLTRLPDAPAGTKGISLFIVPKFLANGERNPTHSISIEHKLGIHGSPTCVMQFDNATGYLVGEPHKGMRYMFTMMNNARLAVGIEGIAIGELAYQQAARYAAERAQGGAPIAQHPDVERMLLTIQANTMAMRLLALDIAASLDFSHHHPDPDIRTRHADRVALLIPVLKAHATDTGFASASTALQVFGGMGYIEETGISQTLRDSRIAMIYEGTNGIQALDLLTRKLAFVPLFLEELRAFPALAESAHILQETTEYLSTLEPAKAAFEATPYLAMFGTIAGALMLAKAAAASERTGQEEGVVKLAKFYREKILPGTVGIKQGITF